jgi:multiple RNA-binding domain-containing protein 1
LIVKNIPKHVTEERLKEHFKSKGFVTDAKIMKKGDKSRLFCFIGYKTEAEASVAKKFFHNTFFDTSRIAVDFGNLRVIQSFPVLGQSFPRVLPLTKH